jgi:hypothetical protein
MTFQSRTHSLKFGGDFRRLAPEFDIGLYFQAADFIDVPSSENGTLLFSAVASRRIPNYLFRNLGLYAQDT